MGGRVDRLQVSHGDLCVEFHLPGGLSWELAVFPGHPFGALKTQMWSSCKAHDATEWLTPFRASCNAARRRRVADAVFRIIKPAAEDDSWDAMWDDLTPLDASCKRWPTAAAEVRETQ